MSETAYEMGDEPRKTEKRKRERRKKQSDKDPTEKIGFINFLIGHRS